MANVFFSYSHADENLRDQLEKQLAMLKHQGIIQTWHDRRIGAGADIDHSIDERINTDEIILLLISPDFLASSYCYDVEMKRALERADKGEAVVIPVILRPCDWHSAPFGRLMAVPKDGKPVTRWPDIDEALLDVAQAVRKAVATLTTPPSPAPPPIRSIQNSDEIRLHLPEPRSSNLRLAKSFTQRDRDAFKHETFDFVAKFFENSLTELGQRNPEYEGMFRRVDANRFFATIYRNGKDVARTTIFMGGEMFRDGICFVQGETTASNSINGALTIGSDDQTMFLSDTGFFHGDGRGKKLSQEGAAEVLWEQFLRPLQGTRW